MEKSIKYWIFLSAIFACTIFLCFKQLKNNNWNRCISSDGKGYYAYLPALFIYHDLQYKFVDHYEEQYYQTENRVNFTNTFHDKKVNKYWIGTALLMSPFFSIAHILALILNYPSDGYSFIYQTLIAIGACFYLLIGLFFMRKLLQLFAFKELEIFITLFAIVFATNLFYYTVAEPSMSHVYSMAAIAAFAYFTKSFFISKKTKYLKLAILILGVVILIRPSNAIVIFAMPFLAGSLNNLKEVFKATPFNKLWPIWIVFVLLISLQLIYYKLSIGQFIIYSYGNEKFNFLAPHFYDFILSYRRGMFVYAPILLVTLLGGIPMLKKSLFQAFSLFLFIMVFIYILSSWWMWYYGGGFGMRPVIDFFVFFAIPLTFLIQYLNQKRYLKWLGYGVIISCVILAQIQTYQKVNFILPWDGINKEIYWKIFLKTNPSYIGKYTNVYHAQ